MDFALREKIEAKTSGIRDLLLAKAFSESGVLEDQPEGVFGDAVEEMKPDGMFKILSNPQTLTEDELWPAPSIRSNGSLPPATFHLLPFRFTRLNGKELLVNEAGEFLFTPSGTVQRLADERLDTNTELYRDLKAKHFVYDDSSSPLLDVLATKVRTKFDHICGGTKLHIFVVTLRCEHSCEYCQVSRQTATRGEFDMSTSTADRAIAMMMDSPARGRDA
jgi:sulfatase maturation enzyme AslB (radical SAM superfamily)